MYIEYWILNILLLSMAVMLRLLLSVYLLSNLCRNSSTASIICCRQNGGEKVNGTKVCSFEIVSGATEQA